jgi:homoserine kinase type II
MGHDVLAAKFEPTLAEAQAAVKDMLDGEILELSPVSGGLLNSNIRLRLTGKDALMRAYPQVRDPAEIAFEVDVLSVLTDSECRVPGVLGEGKIGWIRERPFILLEFLDGRTLEENDIDVMLAGEAGALLGRFHEESRGVAATDVKERGDVGYIHGLLEETMDGLTPDRRRLVGECADRVWAQVGTAEWGAPDGVVHADYYVETLIRLEDGTLALIDFDDAYYGTTFFDVAIGAMEFAANESQDLDHERLSAFLESYRVIRPTTDYPYDRLYDAMLINCLRFLCYTLPLTLSEGDEVASNPYYMRIQHLLGSQPFA